MTSSAPVYAGVRILLDGWDTAHERTDRTLLA